MNIVQTLQMQPSTANFRAIDVSLDNSMAKAGQEVAKGLTSAIGDIAKTYVETKNEAAYGAEISAFERKAADLSEAMQNSDMPLTERKRAVENLYKSSPRLKAEDRMKYAKMFGLDIYADLYKEQESDKVAAQSEIDKATVKGFETQYPGLSTSLSYDEKLSAAKNLQIARSTVAGYLTYQNELDDLNKTVFRGALDVIALQDLRNHLSTTNLSSLNAEQLADMEVQLTQSLAGIGVDLREADDIAKELLEPHIQVLKRYSESSEVSTKALNAAFYNSLPPLARRVLDNPELLQYLPEQSRHNVDVSLAKAATQDQPSIRKAFSYRGSKEANPQAVAQTQTSFNIGFVVANGASREDDSVTRNITLEVAQNTADMQNVSLTGEENPGTQTVVEAVSKLPEEGQKAALNNAAAIRKNVVTILDAYHETEDPVLKEKLKNEYTRALKGEIQASLGLLVPDLKAAEDQKIKLVYDPDKKYARIYEDVSTKASMNPVKTFTRTSNLLFSGGKPQEELEERTYNKGFLGFGGEAERSYLRKVGGINYNYYDAADLRALAWKQDRVLTDDEIGAVWQDVLSDITDKNGYVDISGYISDVGGAAVEGAEMLGEGVGTVAAKGVSAPVEALYSVGEATGEGLAKAKILGDKVDAAALEGLKTAGEGAEDLGNRILKTSEEVFALAGQGAEEAGQYVLDLLKASGEEIENTGKISLELYEEAKNAMAVSLTAIVDKALEAGESTVVLGEKMVSALKNFANTEGLEIKDTGAKTAKVPTQELSEAAVNLFKGNDATILRYEQGDITLDELRKSKAKRSVRNFNPGNIKQSDIDWNNKEPLSKTRAYGENVFEMFETPQAGLTAMAKDIITKIRGRSKTSPGVPLDTMKKILPVYAPKEENDIGVYLSNVEKSFGIKPDEKLDWKNAKQLEKAIKGMIQAEGGFVAVNFYERNGDIKKAVEEAIEYNSK